jgi:hypothetical protein
MGLMCWRQQYQQQPVRERSAAPRCRPICHLAQPSKNFPQAGSPQCAPTCRSRPGSVSVPVLSKHSTLRWPARVTAVGLLT